MAILLVLIHLTLLRGHPIASPGHAPIGTRDALDSGRGEGTIAGIVIGVVLAILLLVLWYYRNKIRATITQRKKAKGEASLAAEDDPSSAFKTKLYGWMKRKSYSPSQPCESTATRGEQSRAVAMGDNTEGEMAKIERDSPASKLATSPSLTTSLVTPEGEEQDLHQPNTLSLLETANKDRSHADPPGSSDTALQPPNLTRDHSAVTLQSSNPQTPRTDVRDLFQDGSSAASPYTPSIYGRDAPDSVPRRTTAAAARPPSLPQEYSLANFAAEGDLPPWAYFSAEDEFPDDSGESPPRRGPRSSSPL